MEASSSKPSSRTTPKAEKTIELPDYEAALEQGFIGVAVDERPNEDYTVEGVTRRAEQGPPDITQEKEPSPA
jgi:hypothetical protein